VHSGFNIANQRSGALGFGLLVAALVIALDQATKLWVLNTFVPGESLPVTSFFDLVLVFNPGAAFSFLADHTGWQRWFFAVIALAISAWIVWQLRSLKPRTWFSLGLGLIMGGALGNLIDRLWLGMVVDFIDLHAAGWHWPAFNVADSAVCVGAVFYVCCQSRSGHPKESLT
jgi:signal peptidase II